MIHSKRFVARAYLAIALFLGSTALLEAQSANGRVTTAAPTYTNNSTAPLSLDTAGNLRTATATGASAQQVQGNIASGVADSGNPVKIGGVFVSGSLGTIATGQRGNAQLDVNANQRVNPVFNTGTGADGVLNTAINTTMPQGTQTAALSLGPVASYIFNGTTWDRQRGTSGAINVNTVASITAALPAGTNNIGDVDVLTLPQSTAYNSLSQTGTVQTCVSVKGSAGAITSFAMNTFVTTAPGAGTVEFFNNAAGNATGTSLYKFQINNRVSTAVSVMNITFAAPITASTGVSMCVVGSAATDSTFATATAL